jgi:Flp pilus assembly protein TadD
MQDKSPAALPYLLKAAKLQPLSPNAHAFLANVYGDLGQTENARREQAEAQRLGTPHP